MSTSPFVKPDGWKIGSWTPNDPVTDGIPDDTFLVGSTLHITPESSSDTYRMDWSDQNGQPCSVSGLHPDPPTDPSSTKMKGSNLSVNFPSKQVSCDLSLILQDTSHFNGTISLPLTPEHSGEKEGPDTGGGTFDATANGG